MKSNDTNINLFNKLISQIERSELARLKAGDKHYPIKSVRVERVSLSDSSLIFRSTPASFEKFPFTGIQWIHIQGITKWDSSYNGQSMPRLDTKERMSDVLSGLYGNNIRILYLIVAHPGRIDILIGTKTFSDNSKRIDQNLNSLRESLMASLRGGFGGIKAVLCVNSGKLLSDILSLFSQCRYYGTITGIPTNKEPKNDYDNPEQLERALKGLYGERWFYLVQAEPVTPAATEKALKDVLEEIMLRSKDLRMTIQSQWTETETRSSEILNRHAQQYTELLEAAVEKLMLGQAMGIWRTGVYFGAPNGNTFNRAMGLFRAVFAGENSRPQPLRSSVLPEMNVAKPLIDSFQQLLVEMPQSEQSSWCQFNRYPFLTMLPTPDVAVLSQLPMEEFPGFSVTPRARFGLNVIKEDTAKQISIGEVLDSRNPTGNTYNITVDDLTKHALICGITGSGKTTVCMGLLVQAWRDFRIPFLVIEPAKSEYRSLSRVLSSDLQVFTLGDETVSPFRLNPFEILPGINVQSHIDHLKSVFNASFILYSPMPYVLEQCLNEVYEDKGWDLLTSTNNLTPKDKNIPSVLFPTLSDLYNKVDQVVARLGYDQRISQDVRAGLKTRIASLQLGAKGSMLDNRMSISMETLLSKPTVLELKRIGDDEEKAFMMGLILMRLYEHREKSGDHPRLQHISLIEEAHRLLANVSTDTSNVETANPKGKSVETFCNLLAEIRAYGEGILIAEQIPSKLAVDAVKNTNLKVLLRTVAEDDRDFLGGAMNLDDAQKRQVTILARGEAIVYAEGLEKALWVKVPNFKKDQLQDMVAMTDDQLKTSMSNFIKQNRDIYTPFAGCRTCRYVCEFQGMVKKPVAETGFNRLLNGYLLSGVLDPDLFVKEYGTLIRSLESTIPTGGWDNKRTKAMVYCGLSQSLENFFESKRRQYQFSLEHWQGAVQTLVDLLGAINQKYLEVKLNDLIKVVTQKANKFSMVYKKLLHQPRGPYISCSLCKHKCLCRYEIASYVWDDYWTSRFNKALDEEDRFKSLAAVCEDVAGSVTPQVDQAKRKPLAICYAVQQIHFAKIKDHIGMLYKIFPELKS